MSDTGRSAFSLTENIWRAVILFTSCAVLIITAWCLSNGITIIFMHLYYIPIVLLAYHYRKKGFFFCILLSMAYLALVAAYQPGDIFLIEGAIIRVAIFIAIAALIVYLSEHLVQVQDELKKTAQVRQSIIQNANVWLMVLDSAGRVLEWNTAAEEMSGYSANEVIGKTEVWKYLYPDAGYRKEITKKITEIISKNLFLENFRTTVLSKNGSQKVILWNTRNLPDAPSGRPSRFIAIGIDVTDPERAEEALKKSEERYRAFFSTSRDCVFITSPDGHWIEFNDEAVTFFGYGSREELQAGRVGDRYADPNERARYLSSINEHGHSKDYPVRLRKKDGTIIQTLITSVAIKDKEGHIQSYQGTIRDVTEQRQAEELQRHFTEELELKVRSRTQELEASLEEKGILLREVHHRVKNNLQIIISLVNLQMRKLDDPLLKQVMAETQNRVRAMSLVHEKLYQSESLSLIDFADYIRFLATRLFSFYAIDTRKVALKLELGKILLDINTAIPLGLVINELVSNSLKHAFPDDRSGTIRISSGYDNGSIRLEVGDDGIGMPPDLDWKNLESLGFRLVNSLVDQLDGKIICEKDGGTVFIISLPEKTGVMEYDSRGNR
ncbi:MAG: PAS domain S-box protein [Methanoregula sp.]|nr:PAS domain S-box protein [Methanoregula sp.]